MRAFYVQPRTKNSSNKIGIGIPSAHNRIQPIAPFSLFKIFISPSCEPNTENRNRYASTNSIEIPGNWIYEGLPFPEKRKRKADTDKETVQGFNGLGESSSLSIATLRSRLTPGF